MGMASVEMIGTMIKSHCNNKYEYVDFSPVSEIGTQTVLIDQNWTGNTISD